MKLAKCQQTLAPAWKSNDQNNMYNTPMDTNCLYYLCAFAVKRDIVCLPQRQYGCDDRAISRPQVWPQWLIINPSGQTILFENKLIILPIYCSICWRQVWTVFVSTPFSDSACSMRHFITNSKFVLIGFRCFSSKAGKWIVAVVAFFWFRFMIPYLAIASHT